MSGPCQCSSVNQLDAFLAADSNSSSGNSHDASENSEHDSTLNENTENKEAKQLLDKENSQGMVENEQSTIQGMLMPCDFFYESQPLCFYFCYNVRSFHKI